MCCCDVDTCCCGCQPLDRGTIVWAVVDMVANTLIIVLYCLAFPEDAYPVGIPWLAWIILWDILLIVGVTQKIPCLLIAWMVFCILNIVYQFIVFFIYAFIAAVGGWLAGTIICNPEFMKEAGYDNCDKFLAELFGLIVGLAIASLSLAIAHIYWFVVVFSLRKQISREVEQASAVVPMQMQPQAYY